MTSVFTFLLCFSMVLLKCNLYHRSLVKTNTPPLTGRNRESNYLVSVDLSFQFCLFQCGKHETCSVVHFIYCGFRFFLLFVSTTYRASWHYPVRHVRGDIPHQIYYHDFGSADRNHGKNHELISKYQVLPFGHAGTISMLLDICYKLFI